MGRHGELADGTWHRAGHLRFRKTLLDACILFLGK